MAPPEPIYLTVIHEYPNIHELQKNGLKPKLMKVIEAFREESNKFFKGKQENTIEQVKEMDKIFPTPDNRNRSNKENRD